MLEIAFAIGIFSYVIYFLGLVGLFYNPILIATTLLYWGAFFFWKRHRIWDILKRGIFFVKKPFAFLAVGYIFLQAIINVIGLFGPEIGFDATWYHLTLPKLYLMWHSIVHIPGGVLYYSDMPKLTEMLYAVGLSFGSDFFARGIHFVFGLLTCIVVYKLGRKFFSWQWALLLPIIFYSNLVVDWESVSGYIDLSRTFFFATSLLAFFTWFERKEKKYLIYSGILVGLTISTKLLSLPDIALYCAALLFIDYKTLSLSRRLKRIGTFLLYVFLCLLPWMTFSFIHTGNPIYPMITSYYVGNYWAILSPLFLIMSVWNTFATSSDPINPIFLALLPFFIIYAKKLWHQVPLVVLFAVGGIIIWYITPQTGGGRYILPYLIPLSVVGVWVIQQLSKKWQRVFIFFLALVACVSVGYRAMAAEKFIPLFSGKESKAEFMATHLQYNLGDFYDTDGYFAHHIKPTDRVLLYNFHNLYYVDFSFVDSTWVKKGDTFNYIAVQGNGMPERFMYWQLVYTNPLTQVRLYNFKGQTWYY